MTDEPIKERKKTMSDNEHKSSKDVNELRDVLDTVSERAPKLIRDIIGTIYSKEAGTALGQSVGAYYKALVESGIPQDAALDMANGYAFSIKDMVGKGVKEVSFGDRQ
ncbi:MAG: hypothetical protein ACOX63_02275 [Christensenellales bacterium]|jgi:hypothetical protein